MRLHCVNAMTDRYILTASILLSGLIAISTHSLKAQETPALWSHCKRVIDTNVVRLQAIPNVKVTANSRFSSLIAPYPDAKANLNRRYLFAIKGSGVENVWKSPDLMIGITQEIINGCVGTAMVTFGRDSSGDFANVGLFPDGKVKIFTCGPYLDSRIRTRPPMTWGQQDCEI